MSRRDLLVEIGTEELPPLSLLELSTAFAEGVAHGLAAAQLKHGRVLPYATPRRLAVHVKGVSEQQPDQEINRRGPPVSAAFDAAGTPTRAALAFAESCGTDVASLKRVQEPKGEFLFFTGRKPGTAARDLLLDIVQRALDTLPIARRMRWGDGAAEFVRPVHWVVFLFGNEVVPGRILEVETGTLTRGHRFHAPKPMRISSPGSYAGALQKRGYVVPDFATRRQMIREGVQRVAAEAGGEALLSDKLLDEVTALVEWPVPLAGHFEPRFLDLPREVLVATLQDHQRYFPVESAGRLVPVFIAVSNIESRDPAQVRAGNERVVRPRLSDAAFFYAVDRKRPLAERVPELSRVTFQARLGSLGDKTTRVRELATELAARIGGDKALAMRAAELAKCDLLTAMVGEFPELQGTMGRYYAMHDREPEEVATALAEHYLPRFAGDELPATKSGLAVSIADKIDTITGIFAVDQKPSGTKDPFGLRRAALGVLRMLIERRIDLSLPDLLRQSADRIRADIARSDAAGSNKLTPEPTAVVESVYDYVMERLRAYYLEGNGGFTVTTEMFDAVLTNKPASPVDFDARLRALAEFLKLDAAASLASANKRIANILKKAGALPEGRAQAELFKHDRERDLSARLDSLGVEANKRFAGREYTEGLRTLAGLREPVDRFFDEVMVMDEDAAVRANRLRLLGSVRNAFLEVADLSRLPGQA
jgi:glycyl-tRNA synthetase beta chain